MKFSYIPLPTRRPVYSLGGKRVRYRPVVPIHVIGPIIIPPIDGCIDSASDDTVLPLRLARRLGIDLTGAPEGEAQPVGQAAMQVKYARVTLLLADGLEAYEWEAIVAFADAPMRWALLGHAGFLEFFDTDLRGGRREVVLVPNTTFSGKHITSTATPP